ncbi:hypothetical protein TcBrA4_0064160 [Trypanosoma cruzi]|nr:hypothetical protein TcBrA4_0064160 [Trypanosoma cruzi]
MPLRHRTCGDRGASERQFRTSAWRAKSGGADLCADRRACGREIDVRRCCAATVTAANCTLLWSGASLYVVGWRSDPTAAGGASTVLIQRGLSAPDGALAVWCANTDTAGPARHCGGLVPICRERVCSAALTT